MVKSLPANAGNIDWIPGPLPFPSPAASEARVQFLGQEDPLEKGMATHSSILAWRIPWNLAGYSPLGHTVGHN